MKKRKFLRMTSISVLLVAIFLSTSTIYGEDEEESGVPLSEAASEIVNTDIVQETDLDLTKGTLTISHEDSSTNSIVTETYDLNESTSDYKYGSKFIIKEGYTYSFFFSDAFTYGEDLISIGVKISNIIIKDKEKRYTDELDYIRIEDGTRSDQSGKLIKKGILTVSSEFTGNSGAAGNWKDTWNRTTDYTVTQEFFSGNETDGYEPYHLDYFIGVQDIDNANYLFDNAGTRDLYYLDAKGQYTWNSNDSASKFMLVKSTGLYRDLDNVYNEGYGGFKEASLFIPLDENENGLSIDVQGWGDVIRYPRIYRFSLTSYKVQYYYQQVDDQGVPYYDPVTKKAIYPDEYRSENTRIGIIGSEATVNETDKTPYDLDLYTIDTDKQEEYSGEIKEDGSLVLKVYFKRLFKVVYNDGVEDEKIFDDQIYKRIQYNEKTPDFENDGPIDLLIREGYTWDGWSPKREDNVLKDGYYEALWEPWKYKIIYEPGCAEGEYTGKMEDRIYSYDHKTMPSDINLFRRDGYEFIGFAYTNLDDFTDIYPEGYPFRSELIKHESKEITLVAQWKKIENREIPKIPVTGID